jgi:hypothetical protein
MRAADTYHTEAGVSAKPREPKPCDHLPPFARDKLVRASQTPVTPHNPLARQVAIDQAVLESRAMYPQLFRKDA